MHGSSRAAAKAAHAALDEVLDGHTGVMGVTDSLATGGIVGRVVAKAVETALDSPLGSALGRDVDHTQLADDLFAVTGALDANIALRRAVADPSRDGADKAALVERLFDGKVGADAIRVTTAAAAQRWSEERDLTDTLESLAVTAVVAGAEKAGRADQLEDDLFRFERIVAGNARLRDSLTDRRADAGGKERLVTELLEGRASEETVRLVRQAVRVPRGRRFDRVLDDYLAVAARRREQLSATVTTAVDLDERQRERLAAALSSYYGGKDVHLNTIVDPTVIGGIRVQIGDDVVDGTILRRLDAAKRHFGA
jgi:F-type H+-transporting ATPase subunit delta